MGRRTVKPEAQGKSVIMGYVVSCGVDIDGQCCRTGIVDYNFDQERPSQGDIRPHRPQAKR